MSKLKITPRWKKVMRDVWSNKTRTLLVVLSIAVGVFAVGGTLSIQDILEREMTRNWRAASPSSFSMGLSEFHKDFVDSVRQMPNVAEAEGRSAAFLMGRGAKVRGVKASGAANDSPLQYIQLYAIDNFDDIHLNKINKAEVPSLDWPPLKRDVVLSTNSLAFLGVNIGENIEVQQPNGQTFTLRVAGTAHTVEEIGGPFMYVATAYVSFDTWAWLGLGRGFNTLLVRAAGTADQTRNRMYLQQVADDIKTRIQRDGLSLGAITIPDTPGEHPAAQTVSGIVALMTAIGVASLIMSSFLVINTVSAVLAQHVRQIGIMKALGGQAGQISAMYFGMVLIFGLLSVLVAVPLGLIGARVFVQFIGEGLLNLRISNYAAPTHVFALQLLIGLIAPVLAAIAPVLAGTRKTVREAISDYGIGVTKEKKGREGEGETGGRGNFLSSSPLLPFPWSPSRPLILSLRNTVRRKGRLMLTLITLVLGGAIFIGVMSARDGLNTTTDVALGYFNYDLELKMQRDYPTDQMERAAFAVPGVTRAESWSFADARRQIGPNAKTDGPALTVIAPPAETAMLKPILRAGRWLTSDDQDAVVLNTDALKLNTDVGLGQVIDLKINGLNGPVRASLKVVGIVQGVLAGPFAYINRPALARITGTSNKANTLMIGTDTRNDAEQAIVAKALEDHFKRVNLPTSGSRLSSSTRAALSSQFNIIIYMLLAMAVLLACVGGLGLAGTMSINVLERTREIGVMRAIGASNGAIRTIVVIEGVVVGVLSWLLGAVLSLPFSTLINSLVGSALEFEVLYTFSVFGLMLWLGAVIGIAAIASMLPAWRASRLSVREILAYG